MRRHSILLPAVAAVAVAAAGCGGAKKSTTQPQTIAPPPPPPPATTAPTTTTSSSAPPLQGEAGSAATGDIPDNQVFLVFRNRAAGYQIKYPEGWAQQGNGKRVVFRDKNNIVQISIGTGTAATTASVQGGVRPWWTQGSRVT